MENDGYGGYGGSGKPINEAATEALANAMYRHTFGIIADGEPARAVKAWARASESFGKEPT